MGASTTLSAPKRRPRFDLGQVTSLFTQHRDAKNLAATNAKLADKFRDQLMEVLINHGTPWGEQGQHLQIELPHPVDGLRRIVRRVSQRPVFNVDTAEAVLKRRRIDLAECQEVTVTVTVPATLLKELEPVLNRARLERFGEVTMDTQFSQERFYAYHQKHRDVLTPGDVESCIDVTETYSFYPEKS